MPFIIKKEIMQSKIIKLPKFEDCTGCMACTDVCAHHALTVMKNQRGFYQIKYDADKCVGCNLCSQVCPVLKKPDVADSVRIDHPLSYMGWSLSDATLKTVASGGAFTEIAASLFSTYDKVAIVGAVWNADTQKVQHEIIYDASDLKRFQSSKYLQSDCRGIYHAVKKLLSRGYYVLFSGTPCQVSAVQNLCRKWTNSLFTVEVICHGVPSFDILDAALSYYNAAELISFRNKERGWYQSQVCTYRMANGKVVTPLGDVFYKMFLSEYFTRPSCVDCHYASMPRFADFTIGDFWGKNKSKNDKGTSLVFVNTHKGKSILSSIHMQMASVEYDEVISNSSRLTSNLYAPLKNYPKLFWTEEYLKMLKGNLLCKIWFKAWNKLVARRINKKEEIVRKNLEVYEKNRHNYHP